MFKRRRSRYYLTALNTPSALIKRLCLYSCGFWLGPGLRRCPTAGGGVATIERTYTPTAHTLCAVEQAERTKTV